MPGSHASGSLRRRWRGPVRLAVAAAVVLLASSLAGVPASSVRGVVAGAAPHAPSPAPLVLLQMNLCNSGMALSCHSFGQAVDEAAGKIRQHSPDLVMAQEVCRDDLHAGDGWGKLAQAMADVHGRDQVSVSFVPARNRYTGKPYQCVNGEPFGNALVHHHAGRGSRSGWYGSQDLSDEDRAWTCATVVEGRLTACSTHLSTNPDVAMRQCRELTSILESSWVMPEVIVAGDFNLMSRPGQAYDVRGCLPDGFDLRGDGARQHVFFTTGIGWVRGGTEVLDGTDHPLLYQRFRIRI